MTSTLAPPAGLTLDELALRVGRRHLADVLADELERGRVTVDDDGRYRLADPDAELAEALRALGGGQ